MNSPFAPLVALAGTFHKPKREPVGRLRDRDPEQWRKQQRLLMRKRAKQR